jgi:hypothetical protein
MHPERYEPNKGRIPQQISMAVPLLTSKSRPANTLESSPAEIVRIKTEVLIQGNLCFPRQKKTDFETIPSQEIQELDFFSP